MLEVLRRENHGPRKDVTFQQYCVKSHESQSLAISGTLVLVKPYYRDTILYFHQKCFRKPPTKTNRIPQTPVFILNSNFSRGPDF